MIHDRCDRCRREFGWTETPICPNCGAENVREAATLASPEKAIRPKPRKRATKRK